jgi:hypothetical protein
VLCWGKGLLINPLLSSRINWEILELIKPNDVYSASLVIPVRILYVSGWTFICFVHVSMHSLLNILTPQLAVQLSVQTLNYNYRMYVLYETGSLPPVAAVSLLSCVLLNK